MDKTNQCALVLAAFNGRIETVQFLVHSDWSIRDDDATPSRADWSADGHVTKAAAIQQSIVAAATTGHVHVSKFNYYGI